MRKMMPCLLLLVLSTTSFAQPADSVRRPATRQDYLRQSKSQLVGGLVLLGLGGAMIGVAAPGNVSFDVLPVLAVGGTLCVLGSVPLFLASGRNKRKAARASVSLDWRTVPVAPAPGITAHTIPSVSLRLAFGNP